MLEKIQQEPGKTQSNQEKKENQCKTKANQGKPNQTELTIEPNSNRFW